MRFLETYIALIGEMAKPHDNHAGMNWYHGTKPDKVEELMRDGYLRGAEIQSKSRMAPQKGKVYITHDLSEGIGYAFFRAGSHFDFPSGRKRNGEFGYLVIVGGNELKDYEPDEDIIADVIPTYFKFEENKYDNYWLRNLAKRKAPKSLARYDRYGNYEYGTHLGKILIKYMTDEQKRELISFGKKAAHDGVLKIKEIWKIPLDAREFLKDNMERFREVSEKIYG